MTPEKGLTEKVAEELRQKLDKFAKGLTAEERQQIVDELAALRKWQQTPSSREDLEKIPMLRREDLTREIRPFVNRIEEAAFAGSNGQERKAALVTHPLHTSGIDYLTFMFDISDLPQKFFPYLGIYLQLCRAGQGGQYLYGRHRTDRQRLYQKRQSVRLQNDGGS